MVKDQLLDVLVDSTVQGHDMEMKSHSIPVSLVNYDSLDLYL